MAKTINSVLLIGLGNIGVGFDAINTAVNNNFLTHARAFSDHPNFSLLGGVDVDAVSRKRFEEIYSIPSYVNVQAALSSLSPDIVVVATPTDTHLQIINEIFSFGQPKVILCEKPLAYNLNDAEQIVEICKRYHCKLYVNFFRQTEPGVSEVRDRIANHSIIGPFKGIVWYSKGIFNSGSHFLCLLQNLLGEIKGFKVINSGRLWKNIDPEPDLDIIFATGRVIFLASREEDFFHNSIELIASNGRLRFEEGGAQILWQGIIENSRFKGYITLNENCEFIPTDYDRIQWYVAENLALALDGKNTELCSAAEALTLQSILKAVKDNNDK